MSVTEGSAKSVTKEGQGGSRECLPQERHEERSIDLTARRSNSPAAVARPSLRVAGATALIAVSFIRALAFLAAFFSAGAVFAQFAPTRFPPQGPQYVEGTAMTQNWLYSGANTLTGDYSGANAVFFEIPDTTTQTLYFAVRNPDVDAVNGTSAQSDPDRSVNTATPPNGPPWVNYALIGGTGAYSAVAGQHLTYATANSGGTQLDSITGSSYAGAFAVGNWVFFNGVSPSQGEHIGNKYYFRLTAVTPGIRDAGIQARVPVRCLAGQQRLADGALERLRLQL